MQTLPKHLYEIKEEIEESIMKHEVEFSDVVKEDNGYLHMYEKQTPDTLDRSTIQTPDTPGCT